MSKCLNPVKAWNCGTKMTKENYIGMNLVWSERQAYEYFMHILGSNSLAKQALSDFALDMPCRKCASCLIQSRKDMTVRLSHECTCHDDICFITLTYNDEHLPNIPSFHYDDTREVFTDCEIQFGNASKNSVPTLFPRDVQLFLKRLRRHLEYRPSKRDDGRDHVNRIRYFAVGEYGGKTGRPHYHLLIFGWKPSDLTVHERRDNYCIYRSAQIEKLWKFGFSTVGDVNDGVARYCARYVTKKYTKIGEKKAPTPAVPEFTLQSVRGGGIGAPWLSRYYKQLEQGRVLTRNRDSGQVFIHSVPKYYYNRLKKIDIELWLKMRDQRVDFVSHQAPIDLDEVRRSCDCEMYKICQAISREVF